MKIALLVRSLNVGGVERQTVAIATALRDRGHHVSVITLYEGGVFAAVLAENAIPVRSAKKTSRWDFASPYVRLVRIIRELDPDVLYTMMPAENIAGVLLRPFFRGGLVWTIQTAGLDLSKYDRFTRFLYRLQALLARAADKVVANSTAGGNEAVAHGFPRQHVTVVQNAINTEIFRPDEERRRLTRTLLGFAPENVVIGIVGRIDPIKDHETFLKAAAIVAREKIEARFVIVGQGENNYEEKCRQLARELGLTERLSWLGARSDMPDIYNAVDLLALSSRTEGLPNAVAEAMASGVVCVATDVGDCREIIGDTGRIVPVGDHSAMAAAMLELLSDHRLRDGAATRARIVNLLSHDDVLRRLETVLADGS